MLGTDFYTKKIIAKQLIAILSQYINILDIKTALEPSSGDGDFVYALNDIIKDVKIDECEITRSSNFFHLPITKHYDLVFGNPPFTKNNKEDTFWYFEDYYNCREYLPTERFYERTKRLRLEEGFMWKSMAHGDTIAFILPVTFCVPHRYQLLKKVLADKFKTIIIYQDNLKWFYNPNRYINLNNQDCCWYIFTNACEHDALILQYKNQVKYVGRKLFIIENVTPRRQFSTNLNMGSNILVDFVDEEKSEKYFDKNGLRPKDVWKHDIPANPTHIAVVSTGKSTIGFCTAIDENIEKVNENISLFKVKSQNRDKIIEIVRKINENREYFKVFGQKMGNCSMGSKEIMEFRW